MVIEVGNFDDSMVVFGIVFVIGILMLFDVDMGVIVIWLIVLDVINIIVFGIMIIDLLIGVWIYVIDNVDISV